MLTNPQKALLKRAQAQAGLSDEEYRYALKLCVGVTSSTDPALGDDHLDILLAFFESIYWREVDAGALQPPCKRSAPFQQRGYWAAKNPAHNTSRDRYTGMALEDDIARLERDLKATGVHTAYLSSIRRRVMSGTDGSEGMPQLRAYRSALERTLAARQRKLLIATQAEADPF